MPSSPDYLAGELPPENNREFERHLAVSDSCV
jgi:anti-sigma factor RsiW